MPFGVEHHPFEVSVWPAAKTSPPNTPRDAPSAASLDGLAAQRSVRRRRRLYGRLAAVSTDSLSRAGAGPRATPGEASVIDMSVWLADRWSLV